MVVTLRYNNDLNLLVQYGYDLNLFRTFHNSVVVYQVSCAFKIISSKCFLHVNVLGYLQLPYDIPGFLFILNNLSSLKFITNYNKIITGVSFKEICLLYLWPQETNLLFFRVDRYCYFLFHISYYFNNIDFIRLERFANWI